MLLLGAGAQMDCVFRSLPTSGSADYPVRACTCTVLGTATPESWQAYCTVAACLPGAGAIVVDRDVQSRAGWSQLRLTLAHFCQFYRLLCTPTAWYLIT